MNNSTKDIIVATLSEYPEMNRRIKLLRYELEHPAVITPEDLLETMNFAKGEGIGSSTHGVSNKTLYIAMNYRSQADTMNAETVNSILARLLPLEESVRKIDYYLSLLTQEEQEVIKRSFFERETLNDISEKMGISFWAARKFRTSAIEKLSEMVDFVKGHNME